MGEKEKRVKINVTVMKIVEIGLNELGESSHIIIIVRVFNNSD